MAPARASASGRVAHCPSCFSHHRGHLLLPPFLPPFSSRVWFWRLDGLLARFSDPLFHQRDPPSVLPPSLLVRKSRPLSSAGPRCSETSHNGVTWPLLSRAHTPGHTLSPILLPYPPRSALLPSPPVSPRPCSCCIMHAPPSSTR